MWFQATTVVSYTHCVGVYVFLLYTTHIYTNNNITAICPGGIVFHIMGKITLVLSDVTGVAAGTRLQHMLRTRFRFLSSQRGKTLPLWEYFGIIYNLLIAALLPCSHVILRSKMHSDDWQFIGCMHTSYYANDRGWCVRQVCYIIHFFNYHWICVAYKIKPYIEWLVAVFVSNSGWK